MNPDNLVKRRSADPRLCMVVAVGLLAAVATILVTKPISGDGADMWMRALKGCGAGTIAGFASGLLGVSPGGILVPVICLVLGVDQHVAQGVSLVAQVPPTSLAGAARYRNRPPVPWSHLALLSTGFLFGGAIGAGAAEHLSDLVLRWMFVLYLLGLAAIAILRGGKPSQSAEAVVAVPTPWMALATIGAVGGFSSGLLGIGGGLAITALSTALIRVGQHRAQAMSLALGALPLTLPSASVYVLQGAPLPWFSIAGLVFGLLVGSALGGSLANRLPERTLRPAFIALIIGMAAFMATRI